MNIGDLEHFRTLLLERENNLSELVNSKDHLLAKDAGKVRELLVEIKQSLDRIENGTYGACDCCDGYVEAYRLEIEPTSRICLDCLADNEKAILEEELHIAGKIYRSLLPEKIDSIQGFKIATQSISAGTIGGDYYDFLPLPDGSGMRVVIADMVGKGLPAGLLMSNVQGALRIFSEEIGKPADLVRRLNQWLCRNIPMSNFVTLACFCIESSGEEESWITYANAGHWPPMLLRSGGEVEMLEPTGGILGVHKDFTFEQKSISMSPGDLLFLYTDGVTESRNGDGEMYEEARLKKFLQEHRGLLPNSLLDNLLQEVWLFRGRSKFDDDLTVIALQKE
jgi:sigma-B regulation protein RsbU (phosphoserine phosphatase)